MKRILLLTALVVATSTVFAQEKKGLAKVQKVSGIEVFVMAEPLLEYTVVDEVNSMYTASVSMVMPQIIENYVDKAKKKSKKENKEFDALIINSEKALLIKWK
jgi:hypothetical protein